MIDKKQFAADFFQGLLLGMATLAVIVAGVAPGRFGVAVHESQFGHPLSASFVTGLARDIYGLAPAATLLVALVWLFTLALSKAGIAPRQNLARFAHGFLFIAFGIALWLFWVGVAEFKVQRGVYPSRFDLTTGADAGFIKSALPTFFLDRYLYVSVVCFVVAALLLALFFLSSRKSSGSPIPAISGFALALGLPALGAYQVVAQGPAFFSSLRTNEEVIFPIDRLFVDFGFFMNEAIGVRAAVVSAPFEPGLSLTGARILGFSKEQGDRLDEWKSKSRCHDHPLSQPLSSFTTPPSNTPAAPLLAALTELSRQLFAGNPEGVKVWHYVMESFRADDLTRFSPAAPNDIAPFVNGLYASAQVDDGFVLAADRMGQSAVRTSHALAATFCGIGGLPLNLSLARDFGNLPFRCLPDLLRDASFDTRAYYGAEMTFDNMRPFFWYHGFETVERKDYPPSFPSGSWGVTDLAMIRHGVKEIVRKDSKTSYTLFLTLTNHVPFIPPPDLPEELGQRVTAAISHSNRQVSKESAQRLLTFAYTDYAVGEGIALAEKSAKPGEVNIFIGHADHVTNDYFNWRRPDDTRSHKNWTRSRIPFFIKLPITAPGAVDQKAYRDAVKKAALLMRTTLLSQNDIPALLTALLSQAPSMERLEPDWRWISYGGQQTTPHYRVEDDRAAIWGINTISQVYYVNQEGKNIASGQSVPSLAQRTDLTTKTPALIPVGAFLSLFLSGYGTDCWDPAYIRASAAQPHSR